MMQINCKNENGFLVISVSGRLDATTASNFESECTKWMEEGHLHMVFELSELLYISSAGLRSVLSMAKKLKKEGGSLSLCSLKGLVQEVIFVSGFDNFLPIHESVEQAAAGRQ